MAGDLSSWDVKRVTSWLTEEGMSQEWRACFEENEIDGVALGLLRDPEQLDAMGIPKAMGSRLKFWQKLDALLKSTAGAETRIEAEAPIPAAVAAPVAEVAVAAASQELPTPMAPSLTPEEEEEQIQKFIKGTQTLVKEATKVAGESVPVPFSTQTIDKLVADEIEFIDGVCELLADLDAKDRDVTLLLDLKSNLQNLFCVVIVGEFNAGKSSLVNALLGSRFCKEGVVPTTTTINMLKYGDGEEIGKTQRNKDYVELFLPVPLLKQVTIVDTPGTNAIVKEQTRLTKGFIPQSDLILFVTSAERPLTETEGKLLEYIQTWGKNVVMVLNKVDLFQGNEQDATTVTEFVRENSARILGTNPPVFAVSGREALKAKLGRADSGSDQREIEDMWQRSRFGELEGFVTSKLGDRKAAAKVKLQSPLGVIEKFLNNYEQASVLGASVSDEDIEVIAQVSQAIEEYEHEVEAELASRLAKLDEVLSTAQRRAKKTVAGVLSPDYIISNLPACLTKTTRFESELKAALDVSLREEMGDIVTGFGKAMRDKENARWLLCSALINERLRGRNWSVQLEKPNLDPILLKMEQGGKMDDNAQSMMFDPEVETSLLSASVSKKAFDIAAASSAVGGGGMLMLELFNAGILDFLTFVATVGGLFFSLGVYPSMMQDDVAAELEARAKGWKSSLKEDVGKLLKEAASSSVFEMEQAFKGYTDAVKTENEKWKMVATRVKKSGETLTSLKGRINSL